MAQIIQLRRDTAANWTTANPTLAQGEVGIELDTRKLKVGNGIDNWTSLAYLDFSPAILSTSTDVSMLIGNYDFVRVFGDNPVNLELPDATLSTRRISIFHHGDLDLSVIPKIGSGQMVNLDLAGAQLRGGRKTGITLINEGGNWWVV